MKTQQEKVNRQDECSAALGERGLAAETGAAGTGPHKFKQKHQSPGDSSAGAGEEA